MIKISISASNSLLQPIHSDGDHFLELLFVKQRMPHLLHVYRGFVLGLALPLKIEGSEGVDDFVYSTLEQYIRSLEVLVKMLRLFDGVESYPDGAWNVSSIIVQFVGFDHFFQGISCGIIVVLRSQLQFREKVSDQFAYLLHYILRLFELTQSGRQEDHPFVLLRLQHSHPEGYGASETSADQEYFRLLLLELGQYTINKGLSLADKLFKRLDVSLLVSLRFSEIQKVKGVNVHIRNGLGNVDAHIGRGSSVAVESVQIKQDSFRL